jgi:serine/threonine-protein kinase RsbW
MAESCWVDVTLETRLESVDLAEEIAKKVASTAGFDEDERHKIGMAVRESIINAIQHGNRNDIGKKVRMGLEFDPARLVITVADQGPGFHTEDLPNPLAEENLLRTSGRGIFIIRSFMDEFRVESGKNGGAKVTMVKRHAARETGSHETSRAKEE